MTTPAMQNAELSESARRIRAIETCMALVGPEARAALTAEIDAALRACPREARPGLLAEVQRIAAAEPALPAAGVHPEKSEAVASAADQRAARALISLSKSFSECLAEMHKGSDIPANEPPTLFDDLERLIARSRAQGRVDRDLERLLHALERSADCFVRQACHQTLRTVMARVRALQPAEVRTACSGPGRTASDDACWRHYCEQVENRDLLLERNISNAAFTEILRNIRRALDDFSPGGTP